VADDTLAQEQEHGVLPGGGAHEETPGGAEDAPANVPEDSCGVEPEEQVRDFPDDALADTVAHTMPAHGPLPGQEGAQAIDPYEGAVPPGYDWPTHGGYLGCLMGLVVAFLVGGFLGSFLVGLISVTPLAVLVAAPAARILCIAVVFVATLIGLGRAGWVLGRRFYREYPRSAGR
jgi:hypothetical protein